MNRHKLKIKAALVTFGIFASAALIVALGMLARAYEGTEVLRYVGLTVFLTVLAGFVYNLALDYFQEREDEVNRIAERIRDGYKREWV